MAETLHISKAKKFLILNIFKDNDIYNQTQKDVLNKFNFFLKNNSKKVFRKFCDYVMSHKIDKNDINNLNLDKYLHNDLKNTEKNNLFRLGKIKWCAFT